VKKFTSPRSPVVTLSHNGGGGLKKEESFLIEQIDSHVTGVEVFFDQLLRGGEMTHRGAEGVITRPPPRDWEGEGVGREGKRQQKGSPKLRSRGSISDMRPEGGKKFREMLGTSTGTNSQDSDIRGTLRKQELDSEAPSAESAQGKTVQGTGFDPVKNDHVALNIQISQRVDYKSVRYLKRLKRNMTIIRDVHTRTVSHPCMSEARTFQSHSISWGIRDSDQTQLPRNGNGRKERIKLLHITRKLKE